MLTVERLEDGEVSPYLADELQPGDELELRGPIGGYFVWEASLGGPVLLVAGGSGHRAVPLDAAPLGGRGRRSVPVRLLYSSRSLDEVIYREELMRLADGRRARCSCSRSPASWPEDWQGHRGRVDRELLDEVAWPPDERPLDLCLRTHGVRRVRGRRRSSRGHTTRVGSGPSASGRREREAWKPLDGNAIAGALYEYFGRR